MPISYVRFSEQRPVTLARRDGGLGGLRVLVFDPVLEEYRSTSLGDRFRQIDIGLRDADAIIFRASTTFSFQQADNLHHLIHDDPIVSECLNSRLVGILGVSGLETRKPEMGWTLFTTGFGGKLLEIDWLSVLRETEIKAFLLATGAERFDPNSHFALPSGVHADKFVSIRRLLSDAVTVERIADWFIDRVEGTEAILLDQEAMLPLGIVLQSLVHQLTSWLPVVRILGDYPADLKTFNDTLLSLSDDITHARRVLFLLSISCTGRLARIFRSIAPRDSGLRVLLSGALDGEEEVEAALCRIPIRRFRVTRGGKCELCRRGSDLDRIDSRTYETVSILPGKKIKATKGRIGPTARFWGIVDEMDAVALHHNDPNTQRHHPVYLKLDRLLGHAEFRNACVDKLQVLDRPDVVIVPGHANSRVVGDLINEAFGETRIEYLPRGENRIPEALRPRLASCEHIMIADDAVITTRTVVDLKFQIYDLCKEYGQDPTLNVFAVVARPVSSQSIVSLRNRLQDHKGGHLHAGWEVFLPYPDRSFCPFCLERDLLVRSLHQLSPEARSEAQNRIRDLRGTLRDPLQGRREERRIGGSFFVEKKTREAQDASSRSVFAAAQAAAMKLLDEAEQCGQSEGRVYRIDDADMLDKFYDAEILGGFLRTFGRKSLSWPANEDQVVSKLVDFAVTRESQDVLGEIGWAAVLGRLPPRPVLNLLESSTENQRHVMLRELIFLNVLGEPLLESLVLAGEDSSS